MTRKSIFEDDIPDLRKGEFHDYVIDDHRFRVTATSQRGCDTGRRRYRVECLTCSEVVHEATTGATWNMEFHMRDVAERAGKPRWSR